MKTGRVRMTIICPACGKETETYFSALLVRSHSDKLTTTDACGVCGKRYVIKASLDIEVVSEINSSNASNERRQEPPERKP